MARSKTTPASTAGSFAPASGRASRVEVDTPADTPEAREQARIDRLWNGEVDPAEYQSTGAWPFTKQGLAEMRGELAWLGAPGFAMRYDLDLRYDPANKATPDEVVAYCNRYIDEIETTKACDMRANRAVLDMLRAREEPAQPAVAEQPAEYTVAHTIELTGGRTIEVANVGGGFKVTRWDDGIGFEYGGDIFGVDGTTFKMEAAAVAAATMWAGQVGGS